MPAVLSRGRRGSRPSRYRGADEFGPATATLHEAAGKIGALPAAFSPVRPGMRLSGPAFPVLGPAGDNLWLHRAIYAAKPGDVIVAGFGAGNDPTEFGHWGEVMAVAALARGLAGLVIDGGVRDGEALWTRNFPTFATSICIRGTAKDPAGAGSLGEAIDIGEVTVHRGDLVFGDDDGVVVIPSARGAAVVKEARERELAEQEIFRRLTAGQTTMDIYGLPELER